MSQLQPGFRTVRLSVLALALAGPALRAEDLISVGYGEGTPGARGILVPVTARHDLPIHGFSLALSYPHSALRLVGITDWGTSTATVGADFFQQELNDTAGTAVLGAIFAFRQPYELAELPSTGVGDLPQLLAWLSFDIHDQAAAGELPIRLVDGLGTPPISNRFTHRGSTIRPQLADGAFVVQSENVLTMESKFGQPGFRLPPLFAFARHPRPLQGFQTAVSFDPRALTLEEVTYTGTTMLPLLGGKDKIEFTQIKWRLEDISISPSEARTTAGVIFDYLDPYNARQVLPPETSSTTSQSILRYSFQPKDGAGAFGEYIPLTLSDSASPDAVNNVFIADSESVVPRKVDGRIYFSTGFLKGKVLDYATGRPISGARLSAEPGGYTANTRADGAFTIGDLEGIPPGPYAVAATRSGYFPGRARGEVAGKGATTDVGTLFLFPVPPSPGGFRRGRVNADPQLDISDGVLLLGFLFLGANAPSCLEAADANDDGNIDLSDAVTLFAYLFTGGKVPSPPFVSCGSDPTPDDLGCISFSDC